MYMWKNIWVIEMKKTVKIISIIIMLLMICNIENVGASDQVTGCNLLGDNTTPIVQWIIDLIQIAVPIIIIIMTIIDFTGIVLSGEEKNFKAAGSKLLKRLIIGVVIILLPMLLAYIIDLSGVLVPYGIDRGQIFCSLF